MIGGNNFISIQLRNQWTGRSRKIIWLEITKKRTNFEKKKFKKFEPEKGGLITLDDDLNVNSQKFEPGKKQIWTVDPQVFFKLHPIAPH